VCIYCGSIGSHFLVSVLGVNFAFGFRPLRCSIGAVYINISKGKPFYAPILLFLALPNVTSIYCVVCSQTHSNIAFHPALHALHLYRRCVDLAQELGYELLVSQEHEKEGNETPFSLDHIIIFHLDNNRGRRKMRVDPICNTLKVVTE
jgi:hypothetical protein